MTTSLRVLSLYSGVGGLDLAAVRSGMEVIAHCEADPFCRSILALRFPGVKVYESDEYVTAKRLLADGIDRVDMVIGGPPCQPSSNAGKRAGAGDSRWRWPQYLRIVSEVRPRWLLAEQPPGILSLNDGGAGEKSSRRWPRWAIGAGTQFTALMPSVRPSVAIGSSSPDGWPTPSAMNPNESEDLATWQARRDRIKAEKKNGNGFGMPLGIAVRQWPSERATDGAKDGPNQHGSKGDLMLPSAVMQWPTGSATDHKGSARPGQRRGQLSEAIEQLWPTPAAVDGTGGKIRKGMSPTGKMPDGSKATVSLNQAVSQLWATPKASPSGPDYARVGRTDSGGDDLATQMARVVSEQWRSPTAYDAQQRHNEVGTNNRLESGKTISLGMQMTTVEHSGSLAPDWVEMLQGLPIGWTDPAVPTEALEDWPGWPARPGAQQEPYEPARTGKGIPLRVARLKALGNMVVPQQAYPVFAAIMAVEEGRDVR